MIRVLAATLLCTLFGSEDDYEALLTRAAEKETQRQGAMRAAHAALDEGAYPEAVAGARQARTLEGEIADLKLRARIRLGTLVPELVGRLDDDDFDLREAASRALEKLGRPALAGLVRLRKTELPAEARVRVDRLLGGITLDREGRVHQWASEASASSQYAEDDWSAKQIVGPPDSGEGDSRTAWAAKEADGGREWIRVGFVLPVRMRRVRIHENLTPGGVVRIDLIGKGGERQAVWEGRDPAQSWFEADLGGQVGRELEIQIDTRIHAGWEEIDAVELIGEDLPD